ncbi:MAG: DUF2752 domain-containing protein [Planctomycetes bacterium]|nr:DUF2752 domain-containing protein [Planctomycetota bacterium]MCH9727928.1 DUF2752 domain-containing protein [Planctomycetota bacterium]MCH9778363.1 DUF2752 domain-containing protein [Planctomycetota bacterium]MCH9789908.1 DUF2752 domain-containing protein [Planctomycetota bacterium]MDF1742882.1 DUF2752 domain-containing protein [Gimesia sp.]
MPAFRASSLGLPIGWKIRSLLIGWSLFLIAGFGVAIQTNPDPRGFGTHQRFGFAPCVIRNQLSIPCPSCGMTTSFSHFVRGQIRQSAQANTAGLVLALVCVVMIPWSWISVYRKQLWLVSNPETCLLWLLCGLITITLIEWVFRLTF